jgi:hypothetical protein
MTLPDERYRAVLQTKDFLIDLLDSKKTPRIPKNIRIRARSLLRHYPESYYMDQVAKQMPGIFAKEIEPVYRMIMKYEEGKK